MAGTTITGFPRDLRAWRQRRRFSQLELALRAGTTQRHLSFLETGRAEPGRPMVVRLGEALDIPLRERNALLLAAGYAPAYEQTAWEEPALETVRAALRQVVDGHEPYPAVVVDRDGTLVLGNDAFRRLFEGVAPVLLEEPVSVPRLLLHPNGLAPRIVNYDEWAWHVILSVADDVDRAPTDAGRELLEELRAYLPAPPPATGSGYLGFAVPLRLRSTHGTLHLLTTLAEFATAVDVTVAELRMEAFLPADADTAAALHKLAGRSSPA